MPPFGESPTSRLPACKALNNPVASATATAKRLAGCSKPDPARDWAFAVAAPTEPEAHSPKATATLFEHLVDLTQAIDQVRQSPSRAGGQPDAAVACGAGVLRGLLGVVRACIINYSSQLGWQGSCRGGSVFSLKLEFDANLDFTFSL